MVILLEQRFSYSLIILYVQNYWSTFFLSHTLNVKLLKKTIFTLLDYIKKFKVLNKSKIIILLV